MPIFESKIALKFPNSLSESKKLYRRSIYNLNPRGSVKKIDSQLMKENKSKIINNLITKPLEIKYSWQDLENWVPPSKKKCNQNNEEYKYNNSTSEMKYPEQVIDISVQTSDSLLKDNNSREIYYPCSVKYSWQIIGKATQAVLDNSLEVSEENYWNGKLITPNSFNSKNKSMSITNDAEKHTNNYIVYTQATQTVVDKELETELTDCRVKYSWQNLTRPYLSSNTYS